MIKKILKLLLVVGALGTGAAAGLFLKPTANVASADSHGKDSGDDHDVASEEGHDSDADDNSHGGAHHDDGHGKGEGAEKVAWFNFSHQFFVPLLRQGDDSGMIILSMALETNSDDLEGLEAQEVRLRDIVLRQLLIAANSGRFDGNFTTEGRMRGLRKQVLEALHDTIGNKVKAVLISDIARQQE